MISIVIPTYNRAANLEPLYHKINETMCDYLYEVIFVDDGGKEDTVRIIRQLCCEHPSVKGILLEYNSGQQNATLAGLRHAQYDTLITVDDDMQDDLQIIIDLIHGLEQGYDVVYGVPTIGHKNLARRVGTGFKEWVFRIGCHKPKSIRLTSCRGINRKTLDYIIMDKVKNVYISARLLQYTTKILNVNMTYKRNRTDKSGYNGYKLMALMLTVMCNYSEIPFIRRFKKTGVQYLIKEIIE